MPACGRRFHLLGGGRLPDNPGDKRSYVWANVLAKFNAEYLDVTHVPVEELNDAPQFPRDFIGHKHESNAACLEIVDDSLPEPLNHFFLFDSGL